MRIITLLALTLFLVHPLSAQIDERPLKLNDQNSDSYFPPATEPYSSKMVETYRVEKPATYQGQGVGTQSFNSNPTQGAHGGGFPYPATREILEMAADKCDEELSILWQQQQNLEPYRRPHFQKCIGEAKVRCDALKKLVIAIKRADEQLFSYQQAVKNAQTATAP